MKLVVLVAYLIYFVSELGEGGMIKETENYAAGLDEKALLYFIEEEIPETQPVEVPVKTEQEEFRKTKRLRQCLHWSRFWLRMPCFYKPKIQITPQLIEKMKNFFRRIYPNAKFTPELVGNMVNALRRILKQRQLA